MKRILDIDDNLFVRLFDNGTELSKEDKEKLEISVRNSLPIRPTGKWIPITYRPMTDDEVKRLEEFFGMRWYLDDEEKKCFSCPMPEHGQEILISTKWGVSKDTCLYDCDEGYFLDESGDWEDVDAWMPLPEKYDGADMRGDKE